MNSTTSKIEGFADRLRNIESVLGLSPSEMASACGCSRSTYYRYRMGKSKPTVEFLENLLNYENDLNAEYLLNGNGSLKKRTTLSKKQNKHLSSPGGTSEDFYNFPLFRMSSLNGKQDKLNIKSWQETKEYIPISKIFLKLFINSISFESAFTMTVEGDSMAPEITPGGIVLVDNKQKVPVTDGIFVVRYDNYVRMNLIQPMPGHKLILSTINQKFASIIVEKNHDGFEILGRIVWTANPI
jgi:transcriptional regulator with XRE-family HTH domain